MISDTHPETEKVLVQLLQQTPVWRKLEMMGELNRTAHSLALEGLRERHPAAPEAELKRYLADLLLGSELARQAYGPLVA